MSKWLPGVALALALVVACDSPRLRPAEARALIEEFASANGRAGKAEVELIQRPAYHQAIVTYRWRPKGYERVFDVLALQCRAKVEIPEARFHYDEGARRFRKEPAGDRWQIVASTSPPPTGEEAINAVTAPRMQFLLGPVGRCMNP